MNSSIIDAAFVSKLVATQFPQWAHLSIQPFISAGTDNTIFRLGKDMVVRLPLDLKASRRVDKECLWLPRLAPCLPLAIPTPIVKGTSTDDYPWHWSIYQWIDGETAILERIANPCKMAQTLAEFINALQKITPTSELLSGQHNEFRGVPLITLDKETRVAIITLQDIFDSKQLSSAWEAALSSPVWQAQPVWLHGDLQSGNLLAKNGQLNAVIDFGLMGVGDPACDLMVAWTLLPAEARNVFRATLNIDDATWERGRGWALYFGLIALAFYLNSNPILAKISRYTINEVLSDFGINVL